MPRVFITNLLVIFLLSAPVSSFAETNKLCPDNLPSTHHIECEARLTLAESEQRLRRAFDFLEQKHQSAAGKEYLQASQAAWVTYRNTSCQYENNAWLSGTGIGANIMLCKIRFNKERTATLEGYQSTIYFDY